MPERLTFMEPAMAAGTEALRTVRPVLADFYGTLDETRRRKIDDLSGSQGFGVR